MNRLDDDDCFYYHSWRNNVVIVLELSRLSCSNCVWNSLVWAGGRGIRRPCAADWEGTHPQHDATARLGIVDMGRWQGWEAWSSYWRVVARTLLDHSAAADSHYVSGARQTSLALSHRGKHGAILWQWSIWPIGPWVNRRRTSHASSDPGLALDYTDCCRRLSQHGAQQGRAPAFVGKWLVGQAWRVLRRQC